MKTQKDILSARPDECLGGATANGEINQQVLLFHLLPRTLVVWM